MFTKNRTIATDDQTIAEPRRRRPSTAHVTAGIALFVALGGTSYAAGSLAANSVGSSQIKASAVKTSELASNSVTTAKVKDGSLKSTDFAAGQLPSGAQGAQGLPGAKGDKGEKGDKGDTGTAGTPGTNGTDGVSGYQVVTGTSTNVTTGDNEISSVVCPAGKKPVGGGVTMTDSISMYVSRSGVSGNGWTVRMYNGSGSTKSFQTQVVCITAS
ncbi:collagen-like triple helix repeat-containing protein [Patulibacter minatonensis]|uniref:collagen-like triple helix repeat-containing protein n=1 Tax=Patulibacter minatonensis TaxID=298163 RepID=UPI0004799656|nr:collagen-like protein [Patulibacter minatonensis]